ncbi:hypothetical protein SSIN_1629 [Streptococcus sinensis]|uniref:Uncharacterized protein n=1 Tax=Streptococcus sinensis TaxID=176090 RepID=A0A0A0DI02_9STRE|nr:hypothetical protein SSIN_1629 [Streptococcus sinensis]
MKRFKNPSKQGQELFKIDENKVISSFILIDCKNNLPFLTSLIIKKQKIPCKPFHH